MTYEELKIKLDLYDPEDVLSSVGRTWDGYWFVVCDEGDCHIFQSDGTEDDIRKVDKITNNMIFADIRKIIIPDSVTNIGSYAFEDCDCLTSVTIPDSVTSIGEDALFGCNGLTNIMISNNVTSIEREAFAFCSRLVHVSIGNGVTSIGN